MLKASAVRQPATMHGQISLQEIAAPTYRADAKSNTRGLTRDVRAVPRPRPESFIKSKAWMAVASVAKRKAQENDTADLLVGFSHRDRGPT